jgi:hypothetical protein
MARGQVIDIPITSGLQEHEDAALTTSLVQCRNGVYRKNGSVDKRYGVASIDTTNTIVDTSAGAPYARVGIPPAEELAEYNGSLVRIGGGDLYTYGKSPAAYAWGGTPSNVSVSSTYLPSQAGGGVENCTLCVVGNYLVHVYTARFAPASANIGLFVDVFDTVTGAPTVQGRYIGLSQASVAQCTHPVAVGIGANAAIAYADSASGTLLLRYLLFNPATLVVVASGGPATALQSLTPSPGQAPYDLVTDGTSLFAAYTLAVGATGHLVKMTAAFAIVTDYALTNGGGVLTLTASGALCVTNGGTSYRTTATTFAAPTLVTWSSSTLIGSPSATLGSTSGANVVFLGTQPASPNNLVSGSYNATTGAVVDAVAILPGFAGCRLESRLASVTVLGQGTRFYAIVSTKVALGTKFLVEFFPAAGGSTYAFANARVRAVLRPQQSNYGSMGALVQLPSGALAAAVLLGGYGSTSQAYPTVSIAIETFTFTSRSVQAVAADGQLTVSGGVVTVFDGSSAVEAGFPAVPVLTSSSFAVGTGGGLTVSTTYSYATTYGYQDAAGNTWEGAPVFATAPALSASQNLIQVTTSSCPATMKLASQPTGFVGSAQTYWVNVYRNTAGSSTFYLVDRVAPAAIYSDSFADSYIQTKAQLYTQGGAVTNDQPPAAQCAGVVSQRAWLGCDDGSVWFSKVFTQGQPVNFSVSQTFQPFEGGPVLAIAALDQNVVLFKRGAIYVITGTGPNDQGHGSFSPPGLVQSDVGILDPKSVVRIPAGLLFRADRGLYLLDQKFNVTNIGKAAEATLGANAVGVGAVTGAVALPGQSLVRFALNTGGVFLPDGSYVYNHALDYDYTTGVFAVHSYALSGNSSEVFSASCLWKGTWTALGMYNPTTFPATVLYQETPGAWVDVYQGTPSFVSTRVQTSPIKAAGVQGYERVWKAGVVGVSREACTLNVRILTDYATTITQLPAAQSHAFSVAAQANWRRGQYQIHLVNQKAEAVSVEVWDSAPTSGLSTGQGFVLQGVALEVAVKSGMRRLSAAQKG